MTTNDTPHIHVNADHNGGEYESERKSAITPLYEKAIVFDRETKDFAGYINGELVGFWPNYHAAEVALDALVLDLISHNLPSEEA